MKNTNKYFFIAVSFLVLAISSCGDNKFKAKDPNEAETLNSGKLEFYVDDAISPVMDSVFQMYIDEAITNVELTVHKVSARDAMSKLMAKRSRLIIIARDYLDDEDSLLKAHNLEPHLQFTPASDALIFFVNENSPLDTLNDIEVKQFLSDENYSLKDIYSLESNLQLISRDINNSEFSALKKIVGKQATMKSNIRYENDINKLISKVRDNDNYIGSALYSQVKDENGIKMLQIGFTDSTGKRMRPAPIHPGYFIMNRYPYRVFYRVYLQESKKDLAYWFAQYCAVEAKGQRYYMSYGIVPEYATFKINIGN